MAKTAQPITADAVRTRLAAQGLAVTADQAGSLAVYLEVLTAWNRRVNLVGRIAWTEILDDLAVDSLHLAAFLESPPVAGLLDAAGGVPLCLDFGAGAGLPGIPLRILWPRGDYVLIEVRAKRAVFLAEALARLSLPRTTVFSGRAEAAPGRLVSPDRPGLVLCLSRAFLPWPKFLEFVAAHLGGLGRPLAVLTMTGGRPADDPGAVDGSGWAIHAESAYAVLGKTRYLSLCVPKNASRALPLKMS
ncbi:MAG: class I SAM-dependent methyltransferase [Desulfovibrionaceae bacterium]|nr:class I SAM-dependent methyltransferase [Desulfovibrionaceae bacterium]